MQQPVEKSYLQIMQDKMMQKSRETAERFCRIQINRAIVKGHKLDYLQPAKLKRAEQNEPVRPYNWEEILQRSKML